MDAVCPFLEEYIVNAYYFSIAPRGHEIWTIIYCLVTSYNFILRNFCY